MAPTTTEPQVRFFSPMPKDYQFVPKGDVYITGNVRKRTHAMGIPLYVVIDKHKKPIGLRCPISIYQEVIADAQATAASRAATVQNRDAAVQREFEAELLRLYPKFPREKIAEVLKHTLEKRSRRVGRTGTLDLETKVQLAAKAYIRHCHTEYEQLLKSGIKRKTALRMIADKSKEVARSWMGNVPDEIRDIGTSRKRKEKRKRKKGTNQSGPRKRIATTRPSGITTKQASGTPRDEEDVTDEASDEDSDGDVASLFEDPDDSDWIP
jgi:hypothetical protein